MQKNTDERHAFRQAFLDVVERERANQFRSGKQISDSDLARAAFPGAGDPVRRWRKIRLEGSSLPIEEAHMLAVSLGYTLSYLTHLAAEEMGKRKISPSNVIPMAKSR